MSTARLGIFRRVSRDPNRRGVFPRPRRGCCEMSSRRTERPPNAGGKEEKPSAAAVNAGSFGLDGSANVVVWRRRDDFGRLGKKRQRVAAPSAVRKLGDVGGSSVHEQSVRVGSDS